MPDWRFLLKFLSGICIALLSDEHIEKYTQVMPQLFEKLVFMEWW
jgi:hypothetical protein